MKNERGSASVELVMLTIPIMVLVAFAVFVGRYSALNQDVTSASRDAARAAALRQFPGPAKADGKAAAITTLINSDVSCQVLDIVIDTDYLHPGGTVTARVTCILLLSDISGFGMPGTAVVEAESVTVVDSFRGGEKPAP